MDANAGSMVQKVHIVHLSYDADVFDLDAAQDSRERQLAHVRCLETRLPGMHTTFVVLSERMDLKPETIGNLTLLPRRDYRLRHIFRLFSYLRRLHRDRPISVLTTQDTQGLSWAALALGRLSGRRTARE